MEPLELHPDRYFDPHPDVRGIARQLYESVKELPLVCPHGHVEPQLLSANAPFPEPTSLLIRPDHYIFRMLYSQGIKLEDLGIPTRDDTPVESDARKIWQMFGDNYHLFRGTPTRAWLDYEFYHVFGIRTKLDGESAMRIYDEMLEKLQSPEFLPRALFDQFNIEVLTTTDAAGDSLEHHQAIRDSGWGGRVVPCFRPDAVFRITSPSWLTDVERLEEGAGIEISSFSDFLAALEDRRRFFKEMGAVSTDHAVVEPFTRRLPDRKVESIFDSALRGEADGFDQREFEAHMLMEMARMSVDDGLVMQIHPGAFRNHNQVIAERFGADKGADIPVQTEYTRNLHELLNAYGNNPEFRLVVFTLDETAYSRELAPLAGHYPSMRLGPAWWFFDSIAGMRRYRELTTETAGIYNTAGFNDDTRAFLSIPSRHDLSRRVDANYVAGLVATHQIDMEDAFAMVRAMSYDLARETYRLDESTPELAATSESVRG